MKLEGQLLPKPLLLQAFNDSGQWKVLEVDTFIDNIGDSHTLIDTLRLIKPESSQHAHRISS